jgi:hypothetical protein
MRQYFIVLFGTVRAAMVWRFPEGTNIPGTFIDEESNLDVSSVGKVSYLDREGEVFMCIDRAGKEYAKLRPMEDWFENHNGLQSLIPLCAKAMTLFGHSVNSQAFIEKSNHAVSYSSTGFELAVTRTEGDAHLAFHHNYNRPCLDFRLVPPRVLTETAGSIAWKVLGDLKTEPPCLHRPLYMNGIEMSFVPCPSVEFIRIKWYADSLMAHMMCSGIVDFLNANPTLLTLLDETGLTIADQPAALPSLVGRMWAISPGFGPNSEKYKAVDVSENDLVVSSPRLVGGVEPFEYM